MPTLRALDSGVSKHSESKARLTANQNLVVFTPLQQRRYDRTTRLFVYITYGEMKTAFSNAEVIDYILQEL
ncbi:hypothetical protein LTR37_000022 [Vermiconidia calcicola]|uniref:Uncharacterized protein n=1 Tax=Vermiconidia calcicola TaxID=1690605 RepID=A0ACC3P1N1_9PEZI|nr:hypothetical protein LTR37_000022 [Vermiconidia calcicola]